MHSFAVAIARNLIEVKKGGDATVNCQHHFKEANSGLYWITPEGVRITSETENNKYRIENMTLVITNAQQSDIGQYLCILISANGQPIPAPPSVNQSFAKTPIIIHKDHNGHQTAESE